jgi:hypothetical protein
MFEMKVWLLFCTHLHRPHGSLGPVCVNNANYYIPSDFFLAHRSLWWEGNLDLKKRSDL